MTSASEIAAQLLAFTVAEFAAAPDIDVSQRIQTLLYSDFEGIAIAAPLANTPGAQHPPDAALPIALAYRMSGARGWDVPLARNTVLVARNLVDGRVLLRDPFAKSGHKRHSERQPLDRDARPPEAQLAGHSAEIIWLDGAKLGLTGLPGDWHLTLVSYDWASNELTLEVSGTRPDPVPREVYLPKVPNPETLRHDPQAPVAPGMTLLADRLPGRPDTVRVSGRLALPNRAHMTPTAADTDVKPDAVVSLTLFALSPNTPQLGWRFNVPAQNTADTVEAAFVVDIGAEGPPLPLGPLVLWGVADEVLVGPILIGAQETE